MDTFDIEYAVYNKAEAPRPIRIPVPGWGGEDVKKENGSEPQPWHCPPFVEASTYGLELVYPYEQECHVINEDGNVRFEWNYAAEPGVKLSGSEFGTFFPRPPKFYFFTTSVDIQAPPGHVVRTQPHPRFFTDETGTVPVALAGHVKTEWWPKQLFMVFKVPPRGQRHIFRTGEPYVQLLFVPQRMRHEPKKMDPQKSARRRALERAMITAGPYLSRNVWHNPAGNEFKDFYKVLGRAFEETGLAGVEQTVREGLHRREQAVPRGQTTPQYLELAAKYQRDGRFLEARDVYFHILDQEPRNTQALNRLGNLAASIGLTELAVNLLKQAVAIEPRSPVYQNDLGEVLVRIGRTEEARACFQAALDLDPASVEADQRLRVLNASV